MIYDTSNRKLYFENEDYLNPETGYPERNVEWFKKNIECSFLENFTNTKNLTLLDVGCAFGYFTKILQKNFYKVYGVDFSENRISYAKTYEDDNIKFILSDLTSDSFLSDLTIKFDCAFTNAVFPHIPLHLKQKAFSNVAKVCKKGSLFILYDGLTDNNCLDNFVGLFSIKWIIENCNDWEYLSHRLITSDGTYEIILRRK